MVEPPTNTSVKDAFTGKKIAHRFNDDWYIGSYRYTAMSGKFKGQRAVYYADDRALYFHKLEDDDCGVDKLWVVLRRVPVREANNIG